MLINMYKPRANEWSEEGPRIQIEFGRQKVVPCEFGVNASCKESHVT